MPFVAQRYKYETVNATDCGFDFPREEIKYLIFSFLRSSNETKRDIEF